VHGVADFPAQRGRQFQRPGFVHQQLGGELVAEDARDEARDREAGEHEASDGVDAAHEGKAQHEQGARQQRHAAVQAQVARRRLADQVARQQHGERFQHARRNIALHRRD
jgi:hypothetical protein